MKQLLFFAFLLFNPATLVFSQINSVPVVISVSDKENSFPLFGATIQVDSSLTQQISITNENGDANFKLSKGNHLLRVSYLGYESIDTVINIQKSRDITIQLKTLSYNTEEAVIKINKNTEILESTNTGTVKLTQKTISNIPGISGQADVIQSFKFAPGIQAANEGNAGLFVRGGSSGQNLILLDNIPLINPSHLIGFFPAFVPDYISSAELYKGNIPVQYGGASSSVINLNVESIQGMEKPTEFDLNVGLLSSSATIKTKSLNNKSETIVSFRKTYYTFTKNNLLKPIYKGNSKIILTSDYDFYDGFLKQSFRLNNKNKLSFSYFQNSDVYNYSDNDISLSNDMKWKNAGACLEWKHTISSLSLLNFIIGYSEYQNQLQSGISAIEFSLSSNIKQKFAKINLARQSANSKHYLTSGIEIKSYDLVPDKIDSHAGGFNYSTNQSYHAIEPSIYISDKINISKKLTFNIGGRLTYFAHIGPYTKIENNAYNIPLDTITYNSNSIVKSYITFDPRMAANYQLNNSSAIKFSIGINTQNLHLVPLGSISLPTDIWYPSTYFLKPEQSKESSLGYYKNFMDKGILFSVEIYGKLLSNQAELKSSIINNFNNSQVEENILIGNGKSYGAEFSLTKNKGKIHSWLSYTISRSIRKFPEINNNEAFPYKYDRIHDASFMLQYSLTKHISISSAFIFATGNTMTVPIERMLIQGELINRYSKPNSYRLPPYHRLDLGLNFTKPIVIWNNNSTITFSFSLYNAYNRKNAHYILLEADETIEGLQINIQPRKISLYPIIPSISTKISF